MRLEDAKDKAKRLIRMGEIMMHDEEWEQSVTFLLEAIEIVNKCRDIEPEDDRRFK